MDRINHLLYYYQGCAAIRAAASTAQTHQTARPSTSRTQHRSVHFTVPTEHATNQHTDMCLYCKKTTTQF